MPRKFQIGDTVSCMNVFNQTDSGFKNVRGFVIHHSLGFAYEKLYDVSSCGLGLMPEERLIESRLLLFEKKLREF